jgi:hypothetical protein
MNQDASQPATLTTSAPEQRRPESGNLKAGQDGRDEAEHGRIDND